MKFTEKEVEHIASLARINLSQKEKEKMAEDLGSILDYVNKLGEVDTQGVEPTAQVTGLENVFREDKNPIPAGEDEKLINQFPYKKDNYLKVKPVFTNND